MFMLHMGFDMNVELMIRIGFNEPDDNVDGVVPLDLRTSMIWLSLLVWLAFCRWALTLETCWKVSWKTLKNLRRNKENVFFFIDFNLYRNTYIQLFLAPKIGTFLT